MWSEHKEKLKFLPTPEIIVALVSHLPSDGNVRPSPKKHIIAGVSICMGVCLLVGVGISQLPFVEPHYDAHGTALTAAGLTFGILISVISFWTLWQTKKIESLQGAYTPGFKKLTLDLAVAIEELHGDFVAHGNSASMGHRVILITKNPYFGLLSFFDDAIERRFRTALCTAAEDVSRSHGTNKFTMVVLCGNKQIFEDFNREFFESKLPNLNKIDRDAKISDANQRTQGLLTELDTKAGEQVVFQGANIPDIQFAIVGHTVFEFILLEPRSGSITGIAGARKIEDGLVCGRFLKQYELIKKLNP
jgi:hypothetical protein